VRPPRPEASRQAPAPAKGGAAQRSGRSAAMPGEVRIIGGQWRRSKLPVGKLPGLRPTPDRVRETLFNWLGQDLSGWRCCDAFAGTGVLGLEAASRGAASVLLVERESHLARQLTATRDRLGGQETVTVRVGDGISALKAAGPASYELVFLDPPYGSELLQPALVAAARVLSPGGFIYAESDALLTAWPDGLRLAKHLKAGSVHAHLLCCGE
jgi:16S rRNA (guanine966-N2)-methyltransferase